MIEDYSSADNVRFENTLENPVYSYLTSDVENYNQTIVYDYTDNTIKVGDNDAVRLVAGDVLISDLMHVFVNGTSLYVDSFHVGSDSQNGALISTDSATGTITVSIVSGVVTLTYGDESYTVIPRVFIAHYDNVNYNYYRISQSNNASTEFYVNSLADVYGATIINTNSLGYSWFNGSNGQIAGEQVTLSAELTPIDGYGNLYKFTLGTYFYDDSMGINANGTNFSPYTAYVPISVVAIEENQYTNYTMLSIIGLMVVLLLVVTVARNLNMRG